ncbi:terminase large subunit domain-containing protein [Nocardia sp. NPDC020380]|uniref:terminase large subunit domain-containing protein n=1 Tax=Nocardia sp. NPDC020380 TaxID=3364309 RepID=UPI0037A2D506
MAKLMRILGIELHDWQAYAANQMCGVRANGKWAATRFGLSVPRQAGKTTLLIARALAGALIFGDKLTIFTAHLSATFMKAFEELIELIESNRDLERLVKPNGIVRQRGREAIRFRNGNVIRFMVRSPQNIRGLSPSLIICDEAQHLNPDTWAALKPAQAAQKNPQVILVGTPPHPGAEGETFRHLRQSGLDEKARVAWLEWSANDGCDPDDRAEWCIAIPTLGTFCDIENVEDDRADFPDDKFMRERLGMWSAASTDPVIDPALWESLTDQLSQIDDAQGFAFGVDVDRERNTATISVCGAREDGLFHVDIAKQMPGTDWVTGELIRLTQQWSPVAIVVNAMSPAASILPKLSNAGLPVVKLGMSDACAATGLFYDTVIAQGIRHVGEPRLSTSINDVRKRITVDGAWMWGRKASEADITAAVSATWALYGFEAKRRRKPKKKAPSIEILS